MLADLAAAGTLLAVAWIAGDELVRTGHPIIAAFIAGILVGNAVVFGLKAIGMFGLRPIAVETFALDQEEPNV